MEGAEEGDDVLAAGVVAGEFEGALDGLGAGVAEVDAVRAGHGCDVAEALGEAGHAFVVEVGAAHVDELGGLGLGGGDDLGVAVAGGGDGDAGGEVEELVAVDVDDAGAAAALDDEGIAAGVTGAHDALVVGDDGGCFGAGEGGLQDWAVLGVEGVGCDAGGGFF